MPVVRSFLVVEAALISATGLAAFFTWDVNTGVRVVALLTPLAVAALLLFAAQAAAGRGRWRMVLQGTGGVLNCALGAAILATLAQLPEWHTRTAMFAVLSMVMIATGLGLVTGPLWRGRQGEAATGE